MLILAALGKLGRFDEGDRFREELATTCTDPSRICSRSLRCFMVDDDLIDDVIDGLRLSGVTIAHDGNRNLSHQFY